jgi:hypothetical protein
LATVKFTTFHVTKLSLQNKIRNIGMVCSAKPVLTGGLYIAQKEGFTISMLHVRYVHLAKAKPVHKRQTHLLVREDVT